MRNFRLRFIIFCLVMFSLSISGCSKNVSEKISPASNSHYIFGKDFQYMYFTEGFFPIMAESKDGYYFLSGNFLYYADKKTMKPVIVCNKPNCLHDEETDSTKISNCNAFIQGADGNQFLAYYDNDLYSISTVFGKGTQEYELIKISLDGTTRKSILKFDVSPTSIAIHRGKVYYTQTVYDKNHKQVYSIKEFDLDKKNSSPHDIYTGNLEGGDIQRLLSYDNNLYFVEYAHNSNIFATRVMRYDILTGKTNRLFTEDDSVDVGIPAIYNNKLYYYINKLDIDGNIKEKKCFTSDLDGSNMKESFVTDYISNTFADNHYLYTSDFSWAKNSRSKEKQGITIVDGNGKPIDSISTSKVEGHPVITCGGDNHLFVLGETDDVYKIYYADKKQFGSGSIKLKPFFEISKDRMFPAVVINHDEK